MGCFFPARTLLTLLVEEQLKRLKHLVKQNEQQQKKIKELEKKIEELERKSNRQAVPFRIEGSKKVKKRKSPGRKRGHRGHYRQPSQEIDKEIKVPLKECPNCNGKLKDIQPVEQIIEELPKVTPKRYKPVTYKANCSNCGQVQSDPSLKTTYAAMGLYVRSPINTI